MRFETMCDPADEWLVYDRSTDLPALRYDSLLIGLSRAEAERLAHEANSLKASEPAYEASVADETDVTRIRQCPTIFPDTKSSAALEMF